MHLAVTVWCTVGYGTGAYVPLYEIYAKRHSAERIRDNFQTPFAFLPLGGLNWITSSVSHDGHCHQPQKLGCTSGQSMLQPLCTIYLQATPINHDALVWWSHHMESYSALLALCVGNSTATGEFPSRRPVTRSFGVFFVLCLKQPLE